MPEWFSIAIEGSTVRRGLKFAVVVGAVLIGINHGDACSQVRSTRAEWPRWR